MTSPSDAQLLAAWRAGDAEAGRALFRSHFSSVYAFFRSKLDNDIDDLVQRTFMACVEASENVERIRNFRAYLMGIARYQLLRYYNEQARGVQNRNRLGEIRSDEQTGLSGALTRRQEHLHLLDALRQLPLELQITLELFYWEQMSLEATAEVTQVPVGTVKSRLYRAKRLLREQIEGAQAPHASSLSEFNGWLQAMQGLRAEQLSSDES